MSSPEARRESRDPDAIRSIAEAGALAVDRLNSALYARRVGSLPEMVEADALLSIAASLVRASAPASTSERDRQTWISNIGALAATCADLAARLDAQDRAIRELHGRLDEIGERP